jgi:hypothetical protein
MAWFNFRQNNSGGSFQEPAINVHIEAVDRNAANALAEIHGVYFDGVAAGRDCGCCGDRWSEQWSGEQGEAVPSQYGTPITDLEDGGFQWGDSENLPEHMIVHADRKVELLDSSLAPFSCADSSAP